MRIEVELFRTRAWWKADGDENACLNRWKREFLEFEVVMMEAGCRGGKAGVSRGCQRLYVPFSKHRMSVSFSQIPERRCGLSKCRVMSCRCTKEVDANPWLCQDLGRPDQSSLQL